MTTTNDSAGAATLTVDQKLERLLHRVEALETLIAAILAKQAGPALEKQLEQQIKDRLSAGEGFSP